jgi:hypothetical protein
MWQSSLFSRWHAVTSVGVTDNEED